MHLTIKPIRFLHLLHAVGNVQCITVDNPAFRSLNQDCHRVYEYNEQESWLLPTERASAVKTRMNGLSCGEKIMTIRSAVLIQYQRVTDRRTDGQNLDS